MATRRPPELRTGNKFLDLLPAEEYARLSAHLRSVSFEQGQTLNDQGNADPPVYFITGGVVAMFVQMDDGSSAEAGMVGREGLAPLSLALGTRYTHLRSAVQNAGHALRMPASTFLAEVRRSEQLLASLFRFVGLFLAQVSQAAACNRLHAAPQRCCRWLLMTHDRVEEDTFLLTQEALGRMLGVRRVSITAAAQRLQDAGLVRYRRGRITIINRPGVEATVCECYRRTRELCDTLTRPVAT